MKRRHWCLLGALAIASACAPAPVAPPAVGPEPSDQQTYPDGRTSRLLSTSELPIVGVTADSQAGGLGPERLADGDLATQWSSGRYQAPSAWAIVELAAAADLTGISLKTGASKAGTAFDIQVSLDGATWQTALSRQTNATWGMESKPFPSRLRGRFVRVLWHNSATNPDARFSIFELLVEGDPTLEPEASPTPVVSATPPAEPTPTPSPEPTPEPTPSTPGGAPGPLEKLNPVQASGSSSYATLAPGRAVDRDLATQWGSDGYRAPEAWLALAYASDCVFEQVRLKTGALPAGVTYRIEVSDDGLAWRDAAGPLTNTTWNMETKTVTGHGRYMRVRFLNSATAPMSRFYFYEIEVLGRKVEGAPAPSPTAPPTESPPPAATPTPSVEPTATPPASPVVQAQAPRPLRRLSTPGSAIASSGTAGMAVDGLPGTSWSPTQSSPQSIAVPLAQHPDEPTLLVAWDSAGYHYTNVNAAPRRYEIHTSADSTDGRDGTWTVALRAVDNPTRSRVDTIQAPGARWVRLVVLSVWSYGPQLRELTVYGAPAADRVNAWLLMGDSITAQSFDPSRPNAFAGRVDDRVPGYRPLLLAGGTGGDTAEFGQQRLSQGLALCPPGSFVGLAYGTNDATRGVPISTFKARLQQMVDSIRASGRTPMLARTSWSLNGTIAQYVRAIDELAADNALPAGPDLYNHFKAHPEQLRDDRVHPTAEGEQAIQRLWAEAVARAYLR